MKKFLWITLVWIISIALSIGLVSAASSKCLNVEFDNWDSVCLGISKNGSKNFRISVDKNNINRNGSLTCRILLPNSKIYPLSKCEGTFPYNWTSTQSVVIYATYANGNNNSHFKRQQAKVNFNDGSRGSSNGVISVSSSSSSSSSSYNDDIDLSTNRQTPSTSQYVNLTIKTNKNYTGKLYLSAKYRRYSSDSWSSISNTSSSYFNDYSSEWMNEYYKMTSSDRGNVTLNSLVKFRKDGYYRIYVKDTDGNESYIQFSVGDTSSSSNDDLEVKASPSNPDTYEWVKLTINTDDDYTGKINFSKFQYRSSSSSSWSSISRTSSTYVSDYSSEWSNGYYRMTSSDDGEAVLKNLIKFKKSWYYRIYVEDTDGNESYIQINVDVSGSSSNDDLEVKASPSNPDTYEWVKLTINTDRDYTGKINFSKFQYRSSSSSSWSTISSRTSSTYVSDYSSEWSNGYYRMTSSDDGEAVLKNLIKFKKSWYYRIYVEDTDRNDAYVQINVDVSDSSSSSNSDKIELSTNRKSPSTSQYVNLTIDTDSTRYTGKLYLSAKYRSSSSASWSSISNTSSTYFNDYSSDWSRGYYKMTSSDKGNVTLNSLVKFRKNGYYRIYVEDTDGNKSYIQFSVGNVSDDDDDSDVSWFTTTQLDKVKKIYKEWNSMVAQMQRQYPSLKKDSYWIRMSDNFYDDMKDVVNNKKSRNFDDYDDFQKAFDDWHKYTMQNI